MSIEDKQSSSQPLNKLHTWDIDKAALKQGAVQAVSGLVDMFEAAKSGEVIIDRPLNEHIRFSVKRSKEGEEDDPDAICLLLNIFHDGTEAGQIELRHLRSRNVWMIPDRQTNGEYQGRGVFSALLAASERFFSDIAEKHGIPHTVELSTGQRKVVEVFEHAGYFPKPEHENIAVLFRHPDQHADELIEQHAWSPPHPKSGQRALLNDRDPYTFRKADIVQKEFPESGDALQVTLIKHFYPQKKRVLDGRDQIRSALENDLTKN